MAIRDITLGQYFPGESLLHKLDARLKILGTLAFLVSLFLINKIYFFIIPVVFLAILIFLSNVPFKYISKGLKPIMFLIIFTMIINAFSIPGEVIVSFWKLKITKEGVERAFFMAIRLVLLIFGSSILTLTTKPIALTDGLENLMAPMSKIGLPSHELAMMMTIALRFIPTLLDETDKIMKAQQARGADFESGNLKQKAQALIPLLVPLFVSAFRIAADLAMAMEARCYHGGEGRTRMHEMKFKKRDAIAFIVFAIYFGIVIASRTI